MQIKPRLLITGGSGYLGRHLCARAVARFDVTATYHTHSGPLPAGQAVQLDLTNREAVFALVERFKPQAILHTAAINPGQGDDALMEQVNTVGSGHVAQAAAAVGARLVHVSTDVVHNGRTAPYADDAPPQPLNAYGRSKAAAEAAVQAAHPGAAIVRTSLIYGLDEMDRGTAGFVERLKLGESLVLFADVLRQPVWVDTLSEALLKLATLDFAGILNVAGRQVLTREEFGRRMLAFWHVDAPPERLHAGRATAISAATPLDLRLHVRRAEQLLQMPFPGVDDVLAGRE
jgi:dTDP-4-dehydrorhamnose reductase